ncbi:uncharacterized protein LOC127718484 [Mytilus californianus]|uniref:uncharacterized protein LOC127718484 n=1 Tax=Mytilus californianus TaxID=6549 RepID=UPI0022461E2F|nr:uncharacterized protein LOC127718484 [Mytilus californianus]
MWASWYGHLEVIRHLLDHGSNIDTQNINGFSALLLAALSGHLEVVQLLIERKCNKEATNITGNSALHFSAWTGDLPMTKWLIEHEGMNPSIKTTRGETPYDLAGNHGYREVMEYLQTVMPTLAEDINPTPSRQLQSTPKVEDDKVPIEIKLMSDKKSVPLYLKLLEHGSERKRDIRLVIVGKKGAGKTSLLKRLFGEEIHNRELTSTNGIEIHRIRCKANYDDGEWYKLYGNNEETQRHARLLKPYEETLINQRKRPMEASVEATAKNVRKNSSETILYMRESQESEAASLRSEKYTDHVTTNIPVVHPLCIEHQPSQLLIEQAYRDIEAMLQSEVDLHDKEKYATLLLWDFAGDEEFYHTHQTFLSPDAIYLVVAKLNEADDKSAQDLFRFWMDSIHCYTRMDEMKNENEDKTRIRDYFDPPVVIVGTWKDSVTSETEEIEDACREKLLWYTDSMADDERGHIRDTIFLSNTKDDDSVYQQIRQYILKLSKTNRTWNTEYPLKFIQLEKRLQEKKKELPIITFQELRHIATEVSEPLRDEELILYLKFHHEIRAVVYFEDLPDYIILDTQWLSDAFKCIVTAKKFRAISIKNQQHWKEFYHKGKLHKEVLEDIFQKEENILYKHKEHILNVMEKFDIIIRPITSERNAATDTSCYYVPCIIKAEPECDIYKMFNVTEDNCQKSSWLCFKFRFLPPHLMNHVIASLCRKYEVAEVGVVQQHERQNTPKRVIALFRGTAVFELKKTTKLSKLLIMTCPNLILVQVLEFGKSTNIERGMYKYIADFVTDEMNKIIGTRFKMTNVRFEKKWECGLVKPQSVIGANSFTEEHITEYYCETCANTHVVKDEWANLQSKTLCLFQSSEETPKRNDKSETTSRNQTISTKVRCFFKGGTQTCSNVSEESTRPGRLRGFTKEEFYFAKMGMIVLNILTDVLYDLIKQDKQNVRLRSDCDITSLYSGLRKLNKHIPSSGWGGTWQTIQSTDIVIGDDIERIRLTRNEILHSETFKVDEKRFNDLRKIQIELLTRFDEHNKPARLYIDHFNEIVAKTFSEEEVKLVQNEIKSEMTIEVEIENQVNVAPQ